MTEFWIAALVLSIAAHACWAAWPGHGPYIHPLSQLASKLPAMRLAEQHDPGTGTASFSTVLGASRETQLPPLPPIELSSNCTEFSGPDPLYCNVSWRGVLFPSDDDLIALYVPAHADPRSSVPVQIAHAAAAPGGDHMAPGQGWAV